MPISYRKVKKLEGNVRYIVLRSTFLLVDTSSSPADSETNMPHEMSPSDKKGGPVDASSEETSSVNGKRKRGDSKNTAVTDKASDSAVKAKEPRDDSESKDSCNLPLLFKDSKVQCGYCNKSYSISTLVKHHWTGTCVDALKAKKDAKLSAEDKILQTKEAVKSRNKRNYQERNWKKIIPEVIEEYETMQPKPTMQQISTKNYVLYPLFSDHQCYRNCGGWKCNPFFVPEEIIKKASQKEIKHVLLSFRNGYNLKNDTSFWTNSWFKKCFLLSIHPDKHQHHGQAVPLMEELTTNINSYCEMFQNDPPKNQHRFVCVSDMKKHFLEVIKLTTITTDQELFDLAVANWEKGKTEYIDGWHSKGHQAWKDRANSAEAAVQGNKTVGAEEPPKEEIDLISISSDENTSGKQECCAGQFCVLITRKRIPRKAMKMASCGRCFRNSHLQCQQIDPISAIYICKMCAA